MGGAIAEAVGVEWSDRSDAQKAVYGTWNSDRNWWEALVRAGFDPLAGGPSAAKKRRVD